MRPWPARPELYSAAYDVRDSGPDGARISGDLRRLGVEYLVIDPMLRDGEGKYGRDATTPCCRVGKMAGPKSIDQGTGSTASTVERPRASEGSATGTLTRSARRPVT